MAHLNLGRAPKLSPWHGAKQDETGAWQLPLLPCEIKGLPQDDPRVQPWRPGEWTPGVDNVDKDEQGERREWGGQKLWEGEKPPDDWDPTKLEGHVQRLLQVPHLPGQPMKETFARQKAIDPRRFEDRFFDDVLQALPMGWQDMVRHTWWAEGFGLHTEDSPAEWQGIALESAPAAYATLRPDTVSLCVGICGERQPGESGKLAVPDAEFDSLDYLYAKDQEGKVVAIKRFQASGSQRQTFAQYSFVPPQGTTSITPFACFRLRGAWQGPPMAWDASIPNAEMQWFSDMPAHMRKFLCDPGKLSGASLAAVERIQYPKAQKQEPVLWPENSWEGNAAKARLWDSTNA